MRAFTDALDARALAALGGHYFTLAPKVTALLNGLDRGTVEITDGAYTSDETAAVRDRCTVEIQLPDVADPAVFDPASVDVSGWTFRVELGVVMPDVITYVTLGTFLVYDVDQSEDVRSRSVTWSGYDITALVRDSRFETAYSIASGTNYSTALQALFASIGLDSIVPTTGFTTPLLLFEEGSDRLQAARDMALSCGWEVKASPYGIPLVKTPGTVSAASWEFVEGDDCRMVKVGKSRTRQQVYNIAKVTGEASGGAAPVSGVAYDNDPGSPTYVSSTTTGLFGRIPVFERSQFVTTSEQATVAAQALLMRKKGIGTALAIDAFTCPALETGDTVRVVRERLGIDELVPIQALTIPLSSSRYMSVTTRETN